MSGMTATGLDVCCVHASTATDVSASEAVAALAGTIPLSSLGTSLQGFWPGNGSKGTIGSGPTQPLGVTAPVDFVQNLSLRDHDDVGSDDLLGSIRIEESERGPGPIAKPAPSPVEGSVHYVAYRME
ncbi:hypothetical protein [Streptomyces atratus]|nr:hypothetical protein [Streptomyces atratus]